MLHTDGKSIGRLVLPALLVACLLILVSTDVPRVHAEESDKRLISVTGQAVINVKPDMASASFGVEVNAPTAQEAQKLNSTEMNKVISALQQKGIAKEDIQTSNFSLYPVYESEEGRPYTRYAVTGYRCNNTVTVRIKDISRVGSVIDAAIGAGATNVNSISFGIQDSGQFEDEILAKAVQDARRKADIMAKAAGVNITGIFRMSDGWVSVSSVRAAKEMMLVDDSSPIEPGEVGIRGTVRIDYTF
ncbi:MAG TPA: SIMPL domain-containing protein [Firmicutes bacterium]|jgi:uncharacterized protein YggE|nr:SIMPL domain-containing protein [Bacillota bacterium]